MSFEALQSEVRALPLEAHRKLMAFMVALQDKSREGYAAKLAQKIDDRSPEPRKILIALNGEGHNDAGQNAV